MKRTSIPKISCKALHKTEIIKNLSRRCHQNTKTKKVLFGFVPQRAFVLIYA